MLVPSPHRSFLPLLHRSSKLRRSVTKMCKPIPILETEFFHDGRGLELQKVVWGSRRKILRGFEYFNPGDVYSEANLRRLALNKVEVYSMASDEVHKHIAASDKSKAAVFPMVDSLWKASFWCCRQS